MDMASKTVNKCYQSLFAASMSTTGQLCMQCIPCLHHRLTWEAPWAPFIHPVVVGCGGHPAKSPISVRFLVSEKGCKASQLSFLGMALPHPTPVMQLSHNISTSHSPCFSLNLSVERKIGLVQHCVPRVSNAGGVHAIPVE